MGHFLVNRRKAKIKNPRLTCSRIEEKNFVYGNDISNVTPKGKRTKRTDNCKYFFIEGYIVVWFLAACALFCIGMAMYHLITNE